MKFCSKFQSIFLNIFFFLKINIVKCRNICFFLPVFFLESITKFNRIHFKFLALFILFLFISYLSLKMRNLFSKFFNSLLGLIPIIILRNTCKIPRALFIELEGEFRWQWEIDFLLFEIGELTWWGFLLPSAHAAEHWTNLMELVYYIQIPQKL